MKQQDDEFPDVRAQRIVVRQVTLEHEGERVIPVAVCPRKLSVMPVAQCGTCQHFAGLCVNPEAGAPFMRCAFDDAPFVHARESDAEPSSSQPFRSVCARDVMTVRTEHATLDMSLEYVLDELLPHVAVLPVIDAAGRAIGVVTRGDLLERLHECAVAVPARGFTLADVTLSPAFRVIAEAPIGHVAAVMAYERVQHVMVVDHDRRLLGIVGALDIVRWLACCAGYVVPG